MIVIRISDNRDLSLHIVEVEVEGVSAFRYDVAQADVLVEELEALVRVMGGNVEIIDERH